MNSLENLPPKVLLSVINTKLRDYYHTLDDLCDDLHLDKDKIIQKLASINYNYDEKLNQFI